METHEKWALVVTAAYLVAPFAIAAPLAAMVGDQYPWAEFALDQFGYLVPHGLVAAWLFRHASSHGHSRWTWAAISMGFGLMAAVLYFVLRSLERPTSSESRAA